MGPDECMNRLHESKVILQPLKMDLTSCSTTRRVIVWTCSYEGDELAKLKEELRESDEDVPNGLDVGETVEFLLDSTSGFGVGSG